LWGRRCGKIAGKLLDMSCVSSIVPS